MSILYEITVYAPRNVKEGGDFFQEYPLPPLFCLTSRFYLKQKLSQNPPSHLRDSNIPLQKKHTILKELRFLGGIQGAI